MTRKKRTEVAQQDGEARATRAKDERPDDALATDAAALVEREFVERFAQGRRLGRLRARSFAPVPPRALRSYAAGAMTPTTLVRVAVEDKLRYEELRAELRRVLGFPLTQLGLSAALVELGRRRREELVALAREGLAEA